jgi:hypothetical protein
VSSEKHPVTPALWWKGEVVTGTATVVMGDYWTRAERFSISSQLAKLTTSHRFITPWRLYSYETLLHPLAPHFQDVASGLR